eukprot:10456536-Lingulodinium_polyedra.AAC.1
MTSLLNIAKPLQGIGACLAADLVTAARKSMAVGVETVSITFALFKIVNVIPKEKSVGKRKAMVSDLLCQLPKKG